MNPDWHQILKTGFDPIDEEHVALLARLDQVVAATNSGKLVDLGVSFAYFVEEVGAHFRHEEALMVEHAFSQASRHKEAHDLFLLDVGRHLAAFREAGLTDDLRRWVMGRLLTWFRFHVSANDAGLAQFLMSRTREAAAPRESAQLAAPN